MHNLSQNLYITYSKQKARDLKVNASLNPLDKVITLDTIILELFESKSFEIVIDEMIASSIIYKIIQTNNIEYFSYLSEDAVSLNTIYSFIVKCKRNSVPLKSLLSGEKLNAISDIDKSYQEYKQKNNLVDIADVETMALENWDSFFTNNYDEIYVDNFKIEEISYIKSKKQEQILEKLSSFKTIEMQTEPHTHAKIIKPSNEVFDNIDEVKTAIKIARKLLEEGRSADEILIVASDIKEYAPLYKLFLDEYEIKGYSSIGTPLTSFYNTTNPKVQIALNGYKSQIQSLTALYKKLDLNLSTTAKENIKASITILDDKIGIELTEPNQIVGLSKKYKHIIFIGTDINHFPPKASDNFLYSYEDEIQYFYANNYFTSSQAQLSELKRLSENLYIITASYSGKRELSTSILIGDEFDETIDVSGVQSISQLSLSGQTKIPDTNTEQYYKSIISEAFTPHDGNGVDGLKATHLSASQINKYISCPLAYLYSNKIKVKAPNQDDEGFDAMEQGSLMHLCYQLFGENIKNNHVTSKDKYELYTLMHQVSIEAYNHDNTIKNRDEENIHHQIFLNTLQAGLKDDRAKGLLAKFVDYYVERADEFNFFKTTEFEKEFALDSDLKPYKLKDKEDKNYFIKGFIDRFDNLENHINIIDYKSKKMGSNIDKAKQEQVETLKDVQLALYILYASQQHPEKEHKAHLLSFKGDNPFYHFANLSTIEGLKDTVLYSGEYNGELKKVISNTKQNIEDGEFVFNNGDEKACGYCDIKFICHEGVLNKKLEKI